MEGGPKRGGDTPGFRGDTLAFGGTPQALAGHPRLCRDSPALGVPGTAAASGPSSWLSHSREDALEVSPSHGYSSLRSWYPSPSLNVRRSRSSFSRRNNPALAMHPLKCPFVPAAFARLHHKSSVPSPLSDPLARCRLLIKTFL